MRHIIIHGHFTIPNNRRDQQELIEICAIKIDENYNELSVFESYCRPINIVSRQTNIVTNISFNNLKEAPYFVDLVQSLKDWIGDEHTLLVTWSSSFIEQIYKLCKINSLEWNYRSIDIQQVFSRQFNREGKLPSLDDALELLGKKFIGIRRIAKLDCINILNVLIGCNVSNFDMTPIIDAKGSNPSMSQRRKVMLADLLKRIINTGSNYLLSKKELIDVVKIKAKNSLAYNNFIEKYGEAEKLEARMNNLLDSEWLDKQISLRDIHTKSSENS